jgi:hypothetical protein
MSDFPKRTATVVECSKNKSKQPVSRKPTAGIGGGFFVSEIFFQPDPAEVL